MLTTAVAVEIHSTHEESHSDTYEMECTKGEAISSYVTGGVEIHFCKMADYFLLLCFVANSILEILYFGTKLFYL